MNFMANIWKINYVSRPPTPEEFLTPKYLGAVADDIYPHVRKVFCDFLNPATDKRVLALSTCIGFGKSFVSTLIIMYLIVQFSYMRNPQSFLNINVATPLGVALLSFTQIKAGQVLYKPFFNILKASPIFHRCTKQERLQFKQQEIGPSNIAYTTAGELGKLQFAKDIHIVTMSSRDDLLGLSLFAGICSEISFWIKKGVSLDDIWGTFQDLRGRIYSRFADRYMTCTILDSSPLDLNLSPIDKWIYSGDAEKDPKVMLVNTKHWDIFSTNTDKMQSKYPVWNKTGETFKIFRGDATRPPRFLEENEDQVFSVDDVYDVPIDLMQFFKDDLRKSICDYCAFPAGAESKLITNFQDIEDSFSPMLKNVYTYIYAPATEPPERLIFDQIVNQFFYKIGENYEFYRYPLVPRYIHIDSAESKDTASISMVHSEMNASGQKVIVVDFCIPIMATKDRINLDAISQFVLDLRNIGKLRIRKVTADRYQSAAMIQRFKRLGFEAEHLSVDRDPTAYKIAISWLLTGRLKCGKNILLKNNWKSLIEVRSEAGNSKIDHINVKKVVREHMLDWDRSQLGFGAKDVSDTVAGASFNCMESEKTLYSYAVWEEESKSVHFEDVVDQVEKQLGLIPRK